MFYEIDVLENFLKFIGKTRTIVSFSIKLQAFSPASTAYLCILHSIEHLFVEYLKLIFTISIFIFSLLPISPFPWVYLVYV